MTWQLRGYSCNGSAGNLSSGKPPSTPALEEQQHHFCAIPDRWEVPEGGPDRGEWIRTVGGCDHVTARSNCHGCPIFWIKNEIYAVHKGRSGPLPQQKQMHLMGNKRRRGYDGKLKE